MKLDQLFHRHDIRTLLVTSRGPLSVDNARKLSKAIEVAAGVRVTSIDALNSIAAHYQAGTGRGESVESYEEQAYPDVSVQVSAAAEDVVEAVHDLERKILRLIKAKANEITELCSQNKGQLKTLKTMKDDHSLAGEKGTYLSAIRKALFQEIVGRVVRNLEGGTSAKIENVKASFDPAEAAQEVVAARRPARSPEGKAGERAPCVPALKLWTRDPKSGGWRYLTPFGVTYLIERDAMSERYTLKAHPTMLRNPLGYDFVNSTGERAKPNFSPKFRDAEAACQAAMLHFDNVQAMMLEDKIMSVFAHGTGQSDMSPEATMAIVNLYTALKSSWFGKGELTLCSAPPACIEFRPVPGGEVCARIIYAADRYEVYAVPSTVELVSIPARGMSLASLASEVSRCLERIKA
mgnify:CR=1 FL=1